MSRIKILIVEDEPLIAEDISGHLESLGYEVSGIAHTGQKAIELLQSKPPDAALLDITLGDEMDGLDVAKFINEKVKIPFIFVTSHADRSTIERVKDTRPGGYLVKPFDENDLMATIEIAVSNYLMAHSPAEVFSPDWINSHLDNPLSERELEVLLSMKDGKTNVQLAESLFLSVNTVKTHLKHIYEKLSVSNRTEALFKINQMINSRITRSGDM
jgi:DNA-binding NarL/FixJ family response regulator